MAKASRKPFGCPAEYVKYFCFFKLFIFIVSLLFILRLFYLQIYDTSSQQLSANNILHLETVFPSRGIIVDANDKIIVENQSSIIIYILHTNITL